MITNESVFSEKAKAILIEAGWVRFNDPPPFPSAILKGWEGLITECKLGYEYSIYEYDNDLSIRKRIELLLTSETLKEYPEFNEFSEKVKSLDDEFRELLQKDTKRSGYPFWWQQGVPQYAGKELADDFFRNYEIKVQIVDSANNSS